MSSFELLTNPVRYLGDARHRVVAIECLRMELGEPDSRPTPARRDLGV